jgi:hypothetical protein
VQPAACLLLTPTTMSVPPIAFIGLVVSVPLSWPLIVCVTKAGIVCVDPLETTRLTAEPVLTEVPVTGLSLITSPEGTVELEALVTVPTTRPAPEMAVVAAACVSPITSGTDTFAGPLETTRLTAEPALTEVPATGLSLITLPEATLLLDCVVTVPATRPAPVMAVVAAACVSPTTFGTDTFAGPLETTRLTAEPALTEVPATGLSLITLPEATLLLDAVVTVPATRPAPVMAVVAAACVSPTTLGTVTDVFAGPLETTRLTAEPALTEVPATGLSLITLPEATLLLDAVVTVPATKPAPVRAVVAAACVSPTTLGTDTNVVLAAV